MKHYLPLSLLLALLVFVGNVQGQNSIDAKINVQNKTKGSFIITPFYEYTSCKKLELTSHTNFYYTSEESLTYKFTGEDIQDYNEEFGTEYINSMVGIKMGYNFLNGLGLSGYMGINHIAFESWISEDYRETHTTGKPGLSLGLAIDYKIALTQKLNAIVYLSYNYNTTETTKVDNVSGLDIIASKLNSMYWESNMALSYTYKKLTPFAGVGFSQQYINSTVEEQIISPEESEDGSFYNVEFDALYKRNAFYGIAGVQYQLNNNCFVYIRSTFAKPVRANLGFRIII